LFTRDLNGNEFLIQATATYENELNGNQTLTFKLVPSKVNDPILNEISEMWEVVDDEGTEYKIVYFKKRGEGERLTIDVKAVPLFFDAFDSTRIYEIYNQHMTANECFNVIFSGSGFNYVLSGSFYAVQWEGFGKGETRLSLFKKALERYKAEFEIRGNTIYLDNLIGRDTQFQYRYRLNASNIQKEHDATAFYTYAKGFGDFADGEENNAALVVEYTSPLASIMRIRHAPPTYDGRVKDSETMLASLKELVDDSLKISVSTDIHDLRKQGYALAQPMVGDRVFLIDERIGLDEEVRVIDMKITKDWKGNVLDLKLVLGSPNITKRHQSNLQNAVDRINGILEGRVVVPSTAIDSEIREATKAIKSAQTELEFNNGIIAREKEDPNEVVVLNSKGLMVSVDGGATAKSAITARGIAAELITGSAIRGISIETDDGIGNKIILDQGEIKTYQDDTPVMSVASDGLRIWHDNNLLAGTLRNEKDLNDSTKDGIELMGHQEYVSLGFRETGTSINNPWIKLDRGPEIDQTTIYGSNVNGSDAGRIDIFSSAGRLYGKNGRVPRVSIRNFNDDTTKWAGMINYIGRDYDAPGYDETQRFGFEVWQYKGTGDGAAEQLLKIDKDANGPTSTRIYTDSGYLPPNSYLKSGGVYDRALGIVLNDSTQHHGVPSGNPILSMYEIPITYSPGTGYSVKTSVNISGARYIWAVYIQLHDGSANYFTCTPTNISKTGYEIWTTINDGVNRDSYAGTELTAQVMVVMQRE
jgi:hypothetical protein